MSAKEEGASWEDGRESKRTSESEQTVRGVLILIFILLISVRYDYFSIVSLR